MENAARRKGVQGLGRVPASMNSVGQRGSISHFKFHLFLRFAFSFSGIVVGTKWVVEFVCSVLEHEACSRDPFS
jgi:hypothetical protein